MNQEISDRKTQQYESPTVADTDRGLNEMSLGYLV